MESENRLSRRVFRTGVGVGDEYIDEGEGMTHSRNIAGPRDEEQHRSKTRTDHHIGRLQSTRPARRGAGHPKPTRISDRHSEVVPPTAGPSSVRAVAAESADAGDGSLVDMAVSLLVVGYVAMVVYFVGLAVGF